MRKNVLFVFVVVFTLLANSSCKKDETPTDRIRFEDFALGSEGRYFGEDLAESYTLGNAVFPINYDPVWGSWSGFAVSNQTDTQTPGPESIFSCIAGSGAAGSDQFAVLWTFSADTIEFLTPQKVTNISVCNTTYSYYSMLNGDAFGKKFGGPEGDDPDYFNLLIKTYDENEKYSGLVTINLADYRFTNNAQDYIANTWLDLDLSDLGFVKFLVFRFESSDNGPFGINTPTTVCIDNIFGELLD